MGHFVTVTPAGACKRYLLIRSLTRDHGKQRELFRGFHVVKTWKCGLDERDVAILGLLYLHLGCCNTLNYR
jgi:hypothetical protein